MKRALTPKSVKRIRRPAHPISNAKYNLDRSVSSQIRPAAPGGRRRSSSAVYRHGSCPVRHRSAQAAARCRNV